MKKQNQVQGLLITCPDNQQEAALRIYEPSPLNGAEPGGQIFYTSTRIGGVSRTDNGYLVKDVEGFAGKSFELKLLGSLKVIKGTVEFENKKND